MYWYSTVASKLCSKFLACSWNSFSWNSFSWNFFSWVIISWTVCQPRVLISPLRSGLKYCTLSICFVSAESDVWSIFSTKKRARERSVNREMIPHVPGFHSRSSQNGVMSRRSKTADGRNKKRHKLTSIAATGDIWDKVGVKWKCQDQVVKVLKKFDVRY